MRGVVVAEYGNQGHCGDEPMRCGECRIAYLEDNVAVLSEMVARMSNVLHCSENSQDVSAVQKQNKAAISKVRATWEKYECNHGGEAEAAEPEAPVEVVQKRGPGRPPKVG